MDEMKRIIVLGMSPDRGGMERYVINLHRQIVRYGIQFDYYVPHNCPPTAYENEITELGGKVYRMAYGRTENIWLHWRNLFRVLSPKNVIGVYINTCVLVDIDFIHVARMLGKPVRIVHSHNSGYMSPLSKVESLLEKQNKKVVGKVCSDLFACSSMAGEWMFGKNAGFHLVHNGIDVEKFSFDAGLRETVRQEMNLSDKLVIGTVGRIQYQKNPEFIVQLFNEIHKRQENSVLLWAGDGDLEDVDRIKELIAQMQLSDCVQLLGSVPNIHELYQAMDAFVLPSRFEGLPFVLVEAQCAGLPCWTSDAVSQEADISGNISFLPLAWGCARWAEEILAKSATDRSAGNRSVREAGYSVEDTARFVSSRIG